jgi:hypothetical protein
MQRHYVKHSSGDQTDGEVVDELEYMSANSIENKNATYHGQTKHSSRPTINYDFKSGQIPPRRKSSSTSCESDFTVMSHSMAKEVLNEETVTPSGDISVDSRENMTHVRKYHRRNSSNSSNINPTFKPDDEDLNKSGDRLKEVNKSCRPTTLDLNSGHNYKKQYNQWHNRSISPIHSSPDSYYDLNSPSSPSTTPQRTVRFNFANSNMNPNTQHNSAVNIQTKPTLIDTPADGQSLDATIPLTAILGNKKSSRKSVKHELYKEFGNYL